MRPSVFSAKELKAGQRLLDQNKIGEVFFSGGTYQVEVIRGKGSVWAFLQLSDDGELKDHFCSCLEGAEGGGVCAHQAAGWLWVTRGQGAPLHMRFRGSFWYNLLVLLYQRCGAGRDLFQASPEGGFRVVTTSGKRLMVMQPRSARGKALIQRWLAPKPEETEENSLKFSNVSSEEIALWREGRPSPELGFALSLWSDIAMWCFHSQEQGKKCTVQFEGNNTRLPSEVHCTFPELRMSCYIAQAHWPELVPSLTTVPSSLRVYSLGDQQIRHVAYDARKREFHLELGSEAKLPPSSVKCGLWSYVPGDGFYATHGELGLTHIITHRYAESFLREYHALLSPYLKGLSVEPFPRKVGYTLSFDDDHALHVVAYLFEVGDLQREGSSLFGTWCFIPGRGFFALEGMVFEQIETVISREDVASFISKHRLFLDQHVGFKTHLLSFSPQLAYELTSESLKFSVDAEWIDGAHDLIEYGEWLYVQGRGFFSNLSKRGVYVVPGLEIPRHDVSSFIRAYRDELEAVSHFFAPSSPLRSVGLNIVLTEGGQIQVTPSYSFASEYQGKGVELFEDVTFVPQEGFCDIPAALRLPNPYFRQVTVDVGREPYFVGYELDTLHPYILHLDPRLRRPDTGSWHVTSLDRAGSGEWIVDMVYVTNLGEVSARELWRAIHQGKKYLFSSAGLIFLKGSHDQWLHGVKKKQWMGEDTKLQLTTLEWIRLSSVYSIVPPQDEKGRHLWDLLRQMKAPSLPLLTGLQSRLRPYQEVGVQWLWFLYQYGLSGLLCDEMGLGKTHQAMALIAAMIADKGKRKILVVCPTSVVFHWEYLLQQFLPHVKVLLYYGAQRSLEAFEADYDLLLTSYGTLRVGTAMLTSVSFDLAIFDEIHLAKNARSRTHQAVLALEARMRLGLTGTPIENNLMELKALFDVVLPGYMPSESQYKEMFVRPIEKQQDPQQMQLLGRVIRPFVLRRKKSDVLLELPEKVETLSYTTLSEEQERLYREAYAAMQNPILHQLQDQQEPIPYIHIFALLTKLKQICNHPALYLGKPLEYPQHSSGKWDLFVELLQEARSSGQKVVVFSQYLGMLDILEHYLRHEGIGFASLRGSTTDRKEPVRRFREDPACEVFVGSLQAAGVGIDLISASVVIHYDRWWNPAKEDQATARAHRMGQRRSVQVFKLATRYTIEERIHQLMEKKSALMEEVVGYDDQQHLKVLTRDDWIELFCLPH